MASHCCSRFLFKYFYTSYLTSESPEGDSGVIILILIPPIPQSPLRETLRGQNFYEVFVYYRSFKPVADLLIGYMMFFENPR